MHLTETCEDGAPHLIVHVATTPAPVAADDVTPAVHEAPRDADLLPGEHIADSASVDAEPPVDSRREYGVDLIGPTRPDYRWQSRAGEGFAAKRLDRRWPAAVGPVAGVEGAAGGGATVARLRQQRREGKPRAGTSGYRDW